MQKQKDGTDSSGVSRDNNSEYNSLVNSYRAAYPGIPFAQVKKDTKAIWQDLKDKCPIGLLSSVIVSICVRFYKAIQYIIILNR